MELQQYPAPKKVVAGRQEGYASATEGLKVKAERNDSQLKIDIMNNNLAFKDLKVWHKAVELADEVIAALETLNTHGHHYRLKEQVEAAVTSISCNIAEGKGRFSIKEYTHFLYIARGSIYETITLLTIFKKRGWITDSAYSEFENKSIEIISMLKGLINSINKPKTDIK